VFRLHKWFLDCVTADGDVLVVYAASLRWGLLRIGYSAALWHRAGTTTVTTRLGRPPLPRAHAGGFLLDAPRLRLHGEWTGPLLAHGRELWRSPRGAVAWHCLLPAADVAFTLGGRPHRGRGYVERLALDVAPWHLPIDELRWGRWHGGGHSLVWIQWRGPHPLRLCLFDGAPVACGPVGDDGVALDDGRRLCLDPPVVLREGRLARTVLAQRCLRLLPVPRRVRDMHETKWLARGAFAAGGSAIAGTALHEVVRWG
jgi:hypothetical protein